MYSERNIDVQIFTTALTGSTPRKIVPEPTNGLDSYTHTIKAVGGFDSASMSFPIGFDEISFWYSRALGCHVETYNPAGLLIWEGFVNKISVDVAGVGFSLGPLLDVANRVRVDYQTQSYNTNPPIPGMAASTTWADDNDSQATYGVYEQIASGGQSSSTEANQKRDDYLARHAWPTGDRQIEVGNNAQISITVNVEMLGYWHILSTYYYAQTGLSSTENLSTKLAAVIAAQPNSIYDVETVSVATNTTPVGRYEDGTRKGLTIIEELLDTSDSSGNLYLAGVRGGREFYYEQLPTSVIYAFSLLDVSRTIREARGQAIVYTWDVQAGEFLVVPELNFGSDVRLDSTSTRSRLDIIFIEQVVYRLPWSVSITGNEFAGIKGRLAKRGLGF